jgi:KinB signaling pathway activation protein
MKSRSSLALRWYLRAAFWVFAISSLGQLLAQRETAATSVWGFAPGWQREIGFFDLTFALLAFSATRTDDLAFQRQLVLAIVILTVLVGTNHLFTVLSGRTGALHGVFLGVNYALVVGGVIALSIQQDCS